MNMSEGQDTRDSFVTALGAISGTSMDGIDIAVIETDGIAHIRHWAGTTVAYPPALREELQGFLADPARAEREPLTDLDRAVTDAFAAAICEFLDEAGLSGAVDLIGLHGQTIWHRPEKRFTRQLGRGEWLAADLGIDVIDAFRVADVQSGGQGAPFAPLYHAALAQDLDHPVAVLNLGGVGNVTFIDGETILAFDTGPASAMIDDYVYRHFDQRYDDGGQIAVSGTPVQDLVDSFMTHPYFDRKPPKALDRQDFNAVMKQIDAIERREDAVATLAAMTIAATAAATAHSPKPPKQWLVAGGGRHNSYILNGLRQAVGVPVEPVETVGWDGDLLEAECFAYLAARARQGLPLSLPTTTGVPAPMPGGAFWPAPTSGK